MKLPKILTHNRDKTGDFQDRVLLHIPIGALTICLFLVHWVLPLALAYVFCRYEDNEDVHTADEAWKDYFGWLTGAVLAGLALFIRQLF